MEPRSLRAWQPLPSWWIRESGLVQFCWNLDEQGAGADNTAALMTLIVIAQNSEHGQTRMTYKELCTAMKISRAKVAKGLTILQDRGIIRRWDSGRSSLQLLENDRDTAWCKLPARPLYAGPTVDAFKHFSLRRPAELDALKLYLLFAALRDNKTNMASVSYSRITTYTGIRRDEIKPAIGLLAALSLAYTERVPSTVSDQGVSNSYRLAGLDPYTHMGTIGRKLAASDFDQAQVQDARPET